MSMTASDMAKRKWQRMTDTQKARHIKAMVAKRWKKRRETAS